MKIKRIIAGIISVACMVMSFTVANAAQHKISYIKVLSDDYTNVTGQIENGANKEIFLRIEYADKTLSTDTQKLEDSVIFQEQVKADENGEFTFSVKLNDIGERMYTLKLGVIGDDEVVGETFRYYGESYREEALNAIKSAQMLNDEDALAEAIKKYYKNLYLKTPMFDAYFAEEPDLRSVKGLLVAYPYIVTTQQLEDALESVVVVKDIKACDNYEEMEDVLIKYNQQLGIIDTTMYRYTYNDLPNKFKNAVFNDFKGRKYYSPEEISDTFILTVLNTHLANAIGAASVKKVLYDNEELLGIDLSEFKFDDEDYLKLVGVKFTDISEVQTKLEEIQRSKKNKPDPSKGGSGSGGGGSYSGGVIAPMGGQETVTQATAPEVYPFNDMENHVWAKEATLALYNAGVLNGVGDNKFEPDRPVSREEFLKMIVGGFDISTLSDNDVYFSDVNNQEWYYPFIKVGVNAGIIKGMDDNTFGIGALISRQDMTVMLYRALSAKTDIAVGGGSSKFEDFDTVADYAKDAVAFAEITGIVNGMGDGNFYPENNATRAEAAVILYRAIEYYAKNI